MYESRKFLYSNHLDPGLKTVDSPREHYSPQRPTGVRPEVSVNQRPVHRK